MYVLRPAVDFHWPSPVCFGGDGDRRSLSPRFKVQGNVPHSLQCCLSLQLPCAASASLRLGYACLCVHTKRYVTNHYFVPFRVNPLQSQFQPSHSSYGLCEYFHCAALTGLIISIVLTCCSGSLGCCFRFGSGHLRVRRAAVWFLVVSIFIRHGTLLLTYCLYCHVFFSWTHSCGAGHVYIFFVLLASVVFVWVIPLCVLGSLRLRLVVC